MMRTSPNERLATTIRVEASACGSWSRVLERRALADVTGDDQAMLQYTSGSTGHPKGVMLTHRNLLANEVMIQETFGHTSNSIVVGCLPFYHDMGLIGNILQPLYLGASCFLLS